MAPKRAAAASAASSSSSDGGALQEKLVRLFEELDGSATKEALEERMSGTAPKGALMAALNSLLAIKRVAISKTAAGGLVFRLQSDQSAKRARTLDGLTAEDRLLYQEIERAGNAGIKSKDLRVRSNLQQQQVAKVLRTLESRGLIRSVKSVAAKNQKLYMLAGLEPSVAVTGGAWYTDDQEFDHALIQVWYHSGGVVHAGKPLSLSDVDSVLQSLVFDAKLEITGRCDLSGGGEGKEYKYLQFDGASLLPIKARRPPEIRRDYSDDEAAEEGEEVEALLRTLERGEQAAGRPRGQGDTAL
ncbi:hypothetical protein EMIHUDRAFT_205297 [Emiliania huxleyi CCMP1516]|uniref:DNA-directed RNA polymerase III subunit RPC6 n=2 Tax=Emiliania huxleyi TaxID=2903 RepID=A0A0D3JUT7_EMIH1|nr:hypothetical protein EMIHUDRAFT_205297 [Emiliania huxleyi CCMP1516]EOD27272.1 hypothetical protein EMIHUDRAFT_205297 [Emiliania huxleyi CCMP1516]|eukprot:XP_005779701.1 hypothetical protein EMIHUDRAFT_205297 [Emiliania huxleyi CCMP1516]